MDGLGRLCQVILVSLAELVRVIACSDGFVQADSYSCWIFLLLLIVFLFSLLWWWMTLHYCTSHSQLRMHVWRITITIGKRYFETFDAKGKKCAAEITIVDNQVMTGSLWHETSPFLQNVETLFIPNSFILANIQELNIFAYTRSARIRQLPTKQLQKIGSELSSTLHACRSDLRHAETVE